MKIEVIPYEPIHAYTIMERNIRERDLWLSKFPDWKKFAEGWKTSGPAFTLVVEGEVVGCGGIILMDWKRGEAWTLLSTLFSRYRKTAFRAIRDNLEQIIKEKDLRRVQSVALPEYPENGRMLEHLGFEREGLLRSFGPNGEDYIMYALIRR